MKKLLVGAVLLGSTSLAMAEAPGGPDCGWGNMLFEGQSGLGPHFLASWTNGTSGNATFGMTSGTNGCSPNGTLTYGGDSLISLTNMMDEFVADAAKGEGEAPRELATTPGATTLPKLTSGHHPSWTRSMPPTLPAPEEKGR